MKNKFFKKVMLMLMVAVMVVTTPVGQAVGSVTGIDVVQTVEAEGLEVSTTNFNGVKDKKKWNKWVKISKKSKYKQKMVSGSNLKNYKETYQTFYKYRITKKKNINKCYKEALKKWNKNQNFVIVGNMKYARQVYAKLEKKIGKQYGLDLANGYYLFSPTHYSYHKKGYTSRYDWSPYTMTNGDSVKIIKAKLKAYQKLIQKVNTTYAAEKESYATMYSELNENERYFEFVKDYFTGRMTYDKSKHYESDGNLPGYDMLYVMAYTDNDIYVYNECNVYDGGSNKGRCVAELTGQVLTLQGYDVYFYTDYHQGGEVPSVDLAIKTNNEKGWWYYSNRRNYKDYWEKDGIYSSEIKLFLIGADKKDIEKEGCLEDRQYCLWENF